MIGANKHRPPPDDRRSFGRFEGKGLVAIVNGAVVDVLDISLSGAKLAAGFAVGAREVSITLIARDDRALMLNESVPAAAVIVRTDDHAVSIRFTRLTYTLAKMIIRHTAALSGVTPHMVK